MSAADGAQLPAPRTRVARAPAAQARPQGLLVARGPPGGQHAGEHVTGPGGVQRPHRGAGTSKRSSSPR